MTGLCGYYQTNNHNTTDDAVIIAMLDTVTRAKTLHHSHALSANNTNTSALAIANFLNERNQDLKKLPNQLKSFGIIFLPALLITLQPDPGSALVYGSLILVLYRFGLPLYYLIIGVIAVLLFILTLYFGYLNTLIITAILITSIIIYFYYQNKKIILARS